jgi:DNA mismatch repair protein MutL
MPIKLLDPKTISLIAAGEVVERPASVVKELVENSLDAGATQVSVETKGGGVSLIRVSDDGSGIPAADVELAFERHATGKISSIDDLQTISSLGFRGEALPSIAAVAEIDVVTSFRGETSGTHLVLHQGKVITRSIQGRSPGTTIAVQNLFRQVPARLKFLKSAASENSHVAGIVSQYALAFPEVMSSLIVDGRTALKTPGTGNLIDAVIAVYGAETARHMLPIVPSQWQGETDQPTVSGMVGLPQISRSDRSYISFFINRRYINSRLLNWAVEEAYTGLIMTGKHPVAIINVAISPEQLDVNIHPTKTEVKFQNERLVFTAVQRAVRQTIVRTAPVTMIEEVKARYSVLTAVKSQSPLPVKNEAIESVPGAPLTPALSLPTLRVVGQFLSSHIVAEGPDGLYLIDQHAAHERILFEKIEKQRLERKVEVQGFLQPVTLEVSPKQEAIFRGRYRDLAEFGFNAEPFGEGAYLVRSIPALMREKDWAAMLRELLDNLLLDRNKDFWKETSATLSCHSAIRAGQALAGEEMRELLRQLEQTNLPNSCPHGRPTMIHLSTAQLKKEFRRT